MAIEIKDDKNNKGEGDSEMRMIDAIDHQDANDDEDRSELPGGWANDSDTFELGDDVNFNSTALKAVLPEEMSRCPHVITSFPKVAPCTAGVTQSASTDEEDVDLEPSLN